MAKRSRIVLVLGVAVATTTFATACKDKPGAGGAIDKAADKELVTKVRAASNAADRTRREALLAAKEKLGPRPDLGPCPVAFKPSLGMKNAFGTGSNNPGIWDVPRWEPKDSGIAVLDNMHFEDDTVAISRVGIAYADEVAVKPGPRWFRVESTAASETLSPYARGELQKYLDTRHEPQDFQLVIDKEVPRKLREDKSFEPGILLGRFYAYDQEKKEIVCAARIAVTSSSDLRFSYTAQYDKDYNVKSSDREKAGEKALRGDLREQALIAASERLFVAGPPRADADADADAAARDGGR